MKVQAYRPASISKVVGKRAEAILNLKGKQQTLCKGKRSRPTVDVTGRGDYIQSSIQSIELRNTFPALRSDLLARGLAEGDGPLSGVFQSISPGNYLEFAADGFLDRNDRMHLEYESRKHRTEFVNGHRIITFHQHMPTPLADSYYEEFDLEIGGRLPLTEYLKDSLLSILVLHGRTLRAFEPADHVLHRHPPNSVGPRNDCCLDELTLAFSCGRANSIQAERIRLLEKHAIAPSAARLCWVASLL